MITAFNAVLECFFTTLCVSAMMLGAAKLGWLPILYMAPLEDMPKDEDE